MFAPTIDSDIVQKPTAAKPERLFSLDVLRGLTIGFMILVNDQTGPAPFHQLVHASWNGFTATDLVFLHFCCWSTSRPFFQQLPGSHVKQRDENSSFTRCAARFY